MKKVNEIADIVREKRKLLGLTQAELSIRSGVPLRTLHGLEAGKTEPRFDTIKSLALTLGLTTEELWGYAKPSTRLSATAISGPLLSADGAIILARLADIEPERRAAALAIIFDDSSLAPDVELSPSLAKPS